MAGNPMHSFGASDSGILDALGGLSPTNPASDSFGNHLRRDRPHRSGGGGGGASPPDDSVFSESGLHSEPHLSGIDPSASSSALSCPAGEQLGPAEFELADDELDEQLCDVPLPSRLLERLRKQIDD